MDFPLCRFCAMLWKVLELMRMDSLMCLSPWLRRTWKIKTSKNSIARGTVFTLRTQWPRESQETASSCFSLCWGNKTKVLPLRTCLAMVFVWVILVSLKLLSLLVSLVEWGLWSPQTKVEVYKIFLQPRFYEFLSPLVMLTSGSARFWGYQNILCNNAYKAIIVSNLFLITWQIC